MSLPRYIVLKSKRNGKYVRYVHEDVKIHGFLQCSGDEAVNPYSKIHVEPAKVGKGLVHLRCCYNNKYWARCSEDNGFMIKARTDEPEEDISKWSCTLFKPEVFGGNILHLVHCQLNMYVRVFNKGEHLVNCLVVVSLVAEPPADNSILPGSGTFTFIDWESLLILPKHVAFKGDNGNYLSARWIEGHQYHQFASTDIGDLTTQYEVFNTADGSIRIKSNYFGKFWRRSPNWIWADSTDHTSDNPDTLFWPVKVDNNVVALRNLGNSNFCKRLTTEGKTNCLNAGVPSITNEARMEVVEPVLSREIYNITFRTTDARIYKQTPIVMAEQFVDNQSEAPLIQTIRFSYMDKRTRTWNASVSLKLGVKTTIETRVPFIAGGKIELSADFSAEFQMSYQWGETQEVSKLLETTYTVAIPPRSNTKVSLIATQGTCDIPYSYTQRDTLIDGERVTYCMDDGVFTGLNCYNYDFKVVSSVHRPSEPLRGSTRPLEMPRESKDLLHMLNAVMSTFPKKLAILIFFASVLMFPKKLALLICFSFVVLIISKIAQK